VSGKKLIKSQNISII